MYNMWWLVLSISLLKVLESQAKPCSCIDDNNVIYCAKEADKLDAESVHCRHSALVLHYMGLNCVDNLKEVFPLLKAVWVGGERTNVSCFCDQAVLVINKNCTADPKPNPNPSVNFAVFGCSIAGSFVLGIAISSIFLFIRWKLRNNPAVSSYETLEEAEREENP